MLRHPWRAATASAIVISASAYTYKRLSTKQESFQYRVRTGLQAPDGKPVYAMHSLPLLPIADVNSRLSSLTSFTAKLTQEGLTWKYATAQLPSNDPIEDAHAQVAVRRDADDGDLLFFAVMDGHSGTHTSRLLSRTLIPAVGLQLQQLAAPPTSYDSSKLSRTSFLDSISSLFSSSSSPKAPGSHTTIPFDSDPKYVSLALQTAFSMVDSEIVNAPLRLISEELLKAGLKPTDPIPDLSQHPMALPAMLPALSGSCALLALLDTAHKDLYVACTGDCRAVAGIWEPAPDGAENEGGGVWRVDVLSADQTGRNPSELKRMQSEHPKNEADTVIRRGRVLGGLEPSRAFGDARYKWPRHVQEMLSRVFLEGNSDNPPMRKMPDHFKTPPYVTAQPVVTHRKLDSLPFLPTPPLTPNTSTSLGLLPPLSLPTPPPTPNTTTNHSNQPTFRFLILATDGLWDELSSSEAVALVGAHLSGLRTPSIPSSSLLSSTKLGPSQGISGKDPSHTRSLNENENANAKEKQWAFVDEHVGTHLLRNAFGGADEMALRKMMSYPPGQSRRFRDDCTVTVVWWEEGTGGNSTFNTTATVSGSGEVPRMEKAKL